MNLRVMDEVERGERFPGHKECDSQAWCGVDLPKNAYLVLDWRGFVIRKGSLCRAGAGASQTPCTPARASYLLQAAARVSAVLLLLGSPLQGFGDGWHPSASDFLIIESQNGLNWERS